jgi:hypothetical protein
VRDISDLVQQQKAPPDSKMTEAEYNRMLAESDRELINTFGRKERITWPTPIGRR